MASLVERDKIENGGSGVLQTQSGEVEHERYLSATKWHKGGRRFRVGCTIGPHRFFANDGVYTPPAELDDWPAIDMKPGLSAQSGVRLTMTSSGYSASLRDDGQIFVSRRGVTAKIRLIGLAWINRAGEVQPIARLLPGMTPVSDEDGWWSKDALGPGIDYGLRLWPDMLRPAIRINDTAALPVPTINSNGLHLVKVLGVGWEGTMPSWSRGTSVEAPLDWSVGALDADVADVGRFQLKNGQRGLWFHEPHAWDSEGNTFEMIQRWHRRGNSHVLLCGLPVADVPARGEVLIDAEMAEQQVSAAADDVILYYSPTPVFAGGLLQCGDVSSGQYDLQTALRFASVPIPSGATLTAMAGSIRAIALDAPIPSMAWTGELASAPAQIVSAADFLARVKTSAEEPWTPAAWVPSTWYDSPDLSGIGNEIVATGRVLGDPMILFWSPVVAGWGGFSSRCRGYAYETSAALAPKLNAVYTEGGGDVAHGFDYWANGQTITTLPGAGSESFDHWNNGTPMMAFLTGGEVPPSPSGSFIIHTHKHKHFHSVGQGICYGG